LSVITSSKNIPTNDQHGLEELRYLLLKKDREELFQLRRILEEKPLLKEKILPIISEELEFFKKEFPVEFNKAVIALIDDRLKHSQDAIVEVIYPMLGVLIQKYIQQQIQQLKDKIDEQIESTFSWKNWKRKFKSFITGRSESDFIIADMIKAEINQVFLIQKGSGLLCAHISKEISLDSDLAAGLLTALSSFASDALDAKTESLDTIQYDTYTIILDQYPNYFVAMVIDGIVSSEEKRNWIIQSQDFIANYVAGKLIKFDETNQLLAEKMKIHFFI
jgi:hypothetical protein